MTYTCELCWGCAKPVKIAIVGQLVSKGAVSKQVPSVKSRCGQLWAAAHCWRECPETRVQRSFSKSCWSLRCVNWFGTTARKRVGEAACAPAVKTALTLANCTQRTMIGESARKLAFPKNVVSSAGWSVTQTHPSTRVGTTSLASAQKRRGSRNLSPKSFYFLLQKLTSGVLDGFRKSELIIEWE